MKKSGKKLTAGSSHTTYLFFADTFRLVNFFALEAGPLSAKKQAPSTPASILIGYSQPTFDRLHLLATCASDLSSIVAMSAVHKPRKKPKRVSGTDTSSSPLGFAIVSEGSLQKPAFPLASFFWPARKGTSQWILLPLTLMVAGLFRWATGLWGYSGMLCTLKWSGNC